MGRREDNKRRKRETLLLEGTVNFAAHGYDGASIEQIAQRSGVARGTFYLYFTDKAALFGCLIDQFFTPLHSLFVDVAAMLTTAPDRHAAMAIYRDMAGAIAFTGFAHRDTMLIAFREGRSASGGGTLVREREQRLLDAAVAMTEVAQARGLIDIPDARLVCLVIYGAVERLTYEVLTGRLPTDSDALTQLAEQVLTLFTGAMGLPGLNPPTDASGDLR